MLPSRPIPVSLAPPVVSCGLARALPPARPQPPHEPAHFPLGTPPCCTPVPIGSVCHSACFSLPTGSAGTAPWTHSLSLGGLSPGHTSSHFPVRLSHRPLPLGSAVTIPVSPRVCPPGTGTTKVSLIGSLSCGVKTLCWEAHARRRHFTKGRPWAAPVPDSGV